MTTSCCPNMVTDRKFVKFDNFVEAVELLS